MTSRAPRRGLRVAAAVASAAVLLTSGVSWAAVNRYAGKVTLVDAGTAGGALQDGQPLTMLVVASDDREGLTREQKSNLHLGFDDYGAHTDTMMLVHLSADGQDITVVSLPRDTLATIPAYTDAKGKKHPSQKAKLNAAFSYGGPKLMVQTVEDITGVTIDHYAEINFAGFLTMVDALDGVEVCLPKATTDKNSGLDLPKGKQTIDGAQALAYVRARYIDPTADIGRMKRQQKFVASMMSKALSAGTLTNPVKIDAFISAVAESVKTDNALGPDQMLDLVDRFKGISPSRIAMTTVPLGRNMRDPQLGDVLTWDEAEATKIFTAMKNDQPIIERPAPVDPSVPKATVAPGQIRLSVKNGTDVKGLGSTAADDLAAVGFAVVGPATNADSPVGATTVIRYDERYSESVKTVAAALPGAQLEPVKDLGRTLQVVVGTDYQKAQKVTVTGSPAPTASSSTTKPRTAADDVCSA